MRLSHFTTSALTVFAVDVSRPRIVRRYDDEEGGGHGEAFNPFAGDEASFRKKEVEMQKRLTRRDGSMMTLAQSKKASQLQADNNAWEENRILTSGAGRLREINLDFDDEEARLRLSLYLRTLALGSLRATRCDSHPRLRACGVDRL